MTDTETQPIEQVCLVCEKPTDALYCGYTHMVEHIGPQLVVRTPDMVDVKGPVATQVRAGWVLEAAESFDIYDDWLNGLVPDEVMAGLIQTRAGKKPNSNSVSRARQAGREQRGLERLSQTWSMDGEVAHLIASDVDVLIRKAWDEGDERTVTVLVDDLVNRFVMFRDRYFHLGINKQYTTADFHREWIAAVLTAYFTGGKALILSPPRHGKSELLVHFGVWAIVRNPDIRIAWIGGNAEIASDMVSAVRNHLESNELLIAETLPDGVSYKPQGKSTGRQWGRDRFRVNNTTVIGQKAPTMTAIGRQGKVLSRDMDLMIVDDLEDHDSTALPSARAKTRSWWSTQISSRKEEHTGMIVIGSRQHADDLYGWILGGDATQVGGWHTIVNSAHDPHCDIDDRAYAEHVDCMLFPEIRSYRWLIEKRNENRYMGTAENFDMVYQNNPAEDTGLIFDPEVIRQALNPDRSIGMFGIKDIEVLLVAGLDPATAGYQAAFLWGYDPVGDKLYMVDAVNEKGGGIKPALKIIQDWYRQYKVKHWVIETNGWQKALIQSTEIKDFCAEKGIKIQPHETQGSNKWDPLSGVSALAIEFDHGRIDLPYANGVSAEIVDQYLRQLEHFRGESGDIPNQRRDKSDILMASWFPWTKQIRRWRKNMGMTHKRVHLADEASYPGYGEHTETPWGHTQYPG